MKERIFISYKRANKDIVFKIKDDIEKNVGEKCWIDLDGIESDVVFANVIMKTINKADVFLFMYSHVHDGIDDFENDWTIRELEYAKHKKKRIVFLNIDNSPLFDWVVFLGYQHKQQVDITSTSAMSRLYSDLSKWLETKDSNIVEKDEKNVTSENGHEWVDLGLSVKWATCNIGANSPEENGNYFAWGETEPKRYYYFRTYKYGTDYYQFTKYTNRREDTSRYEEACLSEDDAATVNWGGNWRMPTCKEMSELIDKCTWTWTIQNGVKGYKIIGKNGNSIFLPATGIMKGGLLHNAGLSGCYWSSRYTMDSAFCLYFNSDYVNRHNDNRYYGLSVRPVCK